MNESLRQDLLAAGAPAATVANLLKFYFLRPDFRAVALFRLYSKWYEATGSRKLLSRLLWLRAIRTTHCYISPLAQIGPGLRLCHATGIVVGKGAKIGANVTIYQNVTIGQKDQNSEAFPVIEDGVMLYAGACVLGDIELGENAVVGANAVVLQDIPKNTSAVGAPARIVNSKPEKLKHAV